MFPEKLKMLRKGRNLNQKEFGKRIGVSKQSVCNWENDNLLPSVEKLIIIANFFKVTPDYLLGFEDDAKEKNYIDVTGLSDEKVQHLIMLVEDLRG